MEKIDQILESLYDRVIEPMEAKEQLFELFQNCSPNSNNKPFAIPDISSSLCDHSTNSKTYTSHLQERN